MAYFLVGKPNYGVTPSQPVAEVDTGFLVNPQSYHADADHQGG